ncbi:MAG TPA: adenylate/guanylate cyclase domain-containing protein, partial [Anaerolineales bacterium]
MSALPSGTVTFLFTDIEGSTRLAQEHRAHWESLRTRHHTILQSSMDIHNGYVFQIIGDAFCVAFHSANDALNAASTAQQSLHKEPWSPAPIKVRMGIHTGAAQLTADNQYSGYTTLALTQRIMSAGHGGQILLSGATRELVRDTLPKNTELNNLGEKRLKDLMRPEHIYQLNITGLPATFPPLKTLDSYPNNLPTHLTNFIGRESEIAEVKQELDEHRLVTLTGSGGTGKTRLSLQVTADLLEQFEHGIWFIELAPLIDPDLIPQTILSAIGIVEQRGKTPLDVLKDYLHEKQALIVLDNCEHLIEASAQVVNTLLRAAPRTKILASSREALGVKGEASYPVPSLSLPDIKSLPEFHQLSQYEAVRLFIDRALLVAPHFEVDKDNAPFIAQICYRLDGIPLAIELAAARVK